MASRQEKIGPKTIAGLEPGETIWDTDLKRFGARCRASKISYFVKAQVDRRQRWFTIGQHGPMTPTEARSRAKALLGAIDAGLDPSRERDVQKGLPTLAELSERWLKEHVALKRRPNTRIEYERIVASHILPEMGYLRLDRITRSDVMGLHIKFAHAPYHANRVLAIMSAMMTFAERLGYREPLSNPCRGVERFKEKKRKRPLTNDELTQVWLQLEELQGQETPWVIGAFRLLILTGCRKSEILTLKWTDVDLDHGVLHLRDAKTGDRDVALSGAAIEALSKIPKLSGNEHVICGAKEGAHVINLQKPWRRLCRAVGLENVRINDLRHTVASVLARTAPMVVVRDALGHRQMQTTSGYSHAASDDVRQAIEQFAGTIVRT